MTDRTSAAWVISALCLLACNSNDEPGADGQNEAASEGEVGSERTDDTASSRGGDTDSAATTNGAATRETDSATEAADGTPGADADVGAETEDNADDNGDTTDAEATVDSSETDESGVGTDPSETDDAATGTDDQEGVAASDASPTEDLTNPLSSPEDGPPAGNPDGDCAIPNEALPEDVATPDHVIGNGTKESCTGEAVVETVALGGVITFDCGPDPVTITLEEPARIYNDSTEEIVIDGGGLVTLSGGGTTRILYMNTCDESLTWTTSHCDNQDHPRLSLQNLTFVDGNSQAEEEEDGGGAVYAAGGRLKIINSRFFNNVCASEGPDVGGAGVRAFAQFEQLPIYVVNTTFGGAEGYGNVCSNGGGLSSIGVSWTIINSLFSHNQAIGEGGNPAEEGTPGGGSGGAIYNDGGTLRLSICGTRIEDNAVNAYGSGIFFVSNNHDGTLEIRDSVIRNNTGGGWNVLPGISMHDDTEQIIANSTIE